jgi:hypothetical protein
MKPTATFMAAELEACAKAAERHGLAPWIVENALYRLKLGETLPPHILEVVQEAVRESELL